MKNLFGDDYKMNRALEYWTKRTVTRLTCHNIPSDYDDIRSRLVVTALNAREIYRERGSDQAATASLYTYCVKAMEKDSALICREAAYEQRVFAPFAMCEDQLEDRGAFEAQCAGLYVENLLGECSEPEALVVREMLEPSQGVACRMTEAACEKRGRGRPPGYRDMMGAAIAAEYGMKPDTVVYHIKKVRQKAKKLLAIEEKKL
jgi:hypothetical protein